MGRNAHGPKTWVCDVKYQNNWGLMINYPYNKIFKVKTINENNQPFEKYICSPYKYNFFFLTDSNYAIQHALKLWWMMTYLPHFTWANFMKRSREIFLLINLMLPLIEFVKLAKNMTKTQIWKKILDIWTNKLRSWIMGQTKSQNSHVLFFFNEQW